MKKLILAAAFSLVGAIAVTAQETTQQRPAETTNQTTQTQQNPSTTDPNAAASTQNTATIDASAYGTTADATATAGTSMEADATAPKEAVKETRKSKKKKK